jgi:hypothetical protein
VDTARRAYELTALASFHGKSTLGGSRVLTKNDAVPVVSSDHQFPHPVRSNDWPLENQRSTRRELRIELVHVINVKISEPAVRPDLRRWNYILGTCQA